MIDVRVGSVGDVANRRLHVRFLPKTRPRQRSSELCELGHRPLRIEALAEVAVNSEGYTTHPPIEQHLPFFEESAHNCLCKRPLL